MIARLCPGKQNSAPAAVDRTSSGVTLELCDRLGVVIEAVKELLNFTRHCRLSLCLAPGVTDAAKETCPHPCSGAPSS